MFYRILFNNRLVFHLRLHLEFRPHIIYPCPPSTTTTTKNEPALTPYRTYTPLTRNSRAFNLKVLIALIDRLLALHDVLVTEKPSVKAFSSVNGRTRPDPEPRKAAISNIPLIEIIDLTGDDDADLIGGKANDKEGPIYIDLTLEDEDDDKPVASTSVSVSCNMCYQ